MTNVLRSAEYLLSAACEVDAVLADLHDALVYARLHEATRNVSGFRSAEYGGVKRRYRSAVNRIMRAFEGGLLTAEEAATAYEELYRTTALRSYTIGLEKAGAEVSTETYAWVEREVSKTTSDFYGLLKDVENDNVRHSWGKAGRRKLIVNRLDGVRNSGWAMGGRLGGTYWWWRLNASSSDTCDDCIALMMMSPFRDAPPAVPRMGATACGSSCMCSLIRTTRDVRESWQLRAVEDLIAEARWRRRQGTPDVRIEKEVIRAAEESRFNTNRLVAALWGDPNWMRTALSASTVRMHEHG